MEPKCVGNIHPYLSSDNITKVLNILFATCLVAFSSPRRGDSRRLGAIGMVVFCVPVCFSHGIWKRNVAWPNLDHMMSPPHIPRCGLCENTQEHVFATRHRHPILLHFKSGAKRVQTWKIAVNLFVIIVL